MENQKIINLLDKSDASSEHFATKKWYIINDENNTNYGVNKDTGESNPDTVKYDTRVLKRNLCDYEDAYILVDGTIRAVVANANTRLALKNCAPFTKCNLEINDEHVDTAENLDIVMPMCNLVEYSDNYQDSSATLYQYKRDEPPDDIADDLTQNNSKSFDYKVKLLGNPVVAGGIGRLSVNIVVPLKYLSSFFRSLEMPLINCKIKLYLTWKKECVLSNQDGNAVFIINDTKLYVPVFTLSKEDNKDFIERQNKGFQRSIYWNEYKTKEQTENADANATKYINLDPSFQGVNRLLLMVYSREDDNQATRNGQRKYYLPRIDFKKYNVIIDGRNVYDNPIKSDIEKYRELKTVMIGKGENYTTGSLLDYNYFNKHYKLVAVDLSKQKELNEDQRAIQQIEFKYMLEVNSTIYIFIINYLLEKSKETILEFYKGTVKLY